MATLLITHSITEFLHELTFNRHFSAHTLTAYQNDLHQFKNFLSSQYELEDVAVVKGLHIRSWLAALKEEGQSDRSLNRKMSTLQSFFHFLLENEQIKHNPTRQVILHRKTKSLPTFLEESQTTRLFEAGLFPDTFEGFTSRLIIELLYQTGIRRSELVQLKEADVHLSRKELLVFGKGRKERLIPLNDFLLKDIEEYISLKRKLFNHPTEYLLSLKSGKKIYDQYVYRTVKRYLNEVTTLEKKSPHLLRHTFATQLLNNGADLMAIKDLLGHSGLAATQIYTHVNIEQLKNVYKKAHPKS